MTITITAFERSPDGGKGLARDTRVRWALEEVGQPYEVRLVSFEAMKEPAHLALHPFGQIPTYEEGEPRPVRDRGDRVPHRAAPCGLLPDDAMPGRARSHGCSPRSARWSRRSLNSQPPGYSRATSPGPRSACRSCWIAFATGSASLSHRLGAADWLDGAFSAGDLMMVSVLLRVRMSGLLNEYPNLAAYVARGEARPAYKRAFDAQLAVNTGKQTAG